MECKTKDDGMDENTLHCCYDEYVATNQQTQINKICCRDFASLHVTSFSEVFQNLLFVVGFSKGLAKCFD